MREGIYTVNTWKHELKFLLNSIQVIESTQKWVKLNVYISHKICIHDPLPTFQWDHDLLLL